MKHQSQKWYGIKFSQIIFQLITLLRILFNSNSSAVHAMCSILDNVLQDNAMIFYFFCLLNEIDNAMILIVINDAYSKICKCHLGKNSFSVVFFEIARMSSSKSSRGLPSKLVFTKVIEYKLAMKAFFASFEVLVYWRKLKNKKSRIT